MLTSPRVVGYVRTSGAPGQDDGDRQARDLAAAAERTGWTMLEMVREVASGARADRPGLAKILELARSGAVDAVAVCELSRLSRGGIGAIFDIVRELDRAGVRILSLSEPWASGDGPTRDLLLAVMGWASRLERDLLIERTKSGIARARAEGGRVGRPPIVNSELIAEINRLRDRERLQWSQIAVRVHHPATSCRKWYSTSRVAKPRVINGGNEIRSPSDTSSRTSAT